MTWEKYIQGIKNVTSDSSKFIPLNIPPKDHINYIVNVGIAYNFLITYMTIIKSVNMSFTKFVLYVLDQESYMTIQRFIKPVVVNLPKFRPILSAINIPGYNVAKFLYLF